MSETADLPVDLNRERLWRLLENDEQWDQIMESNAPAAKRVQRWLFHDVLPTIRKTGSYSGSPEVLDAMLAALAELEPSLRA